MAEVKVPDIGDFEEVPVIEILVEVGQEVAEEDPLVTLESDKATMDVPSPQAGKVEEILVSVGDKVSEGTPVVRLGGADGGEQKADVEPGEQAEEKPEEKREEKPEEDEGEPEPSAETEDSGDDEHVDAPGRQPLQDVPDTPAPTSGEPIYASPSVRRLAREKGIDLSTVRGSGRGGRITREDLDRAGEAPAAAAAPRAEAAEGDERVELTRIQRLSGPNVTTSWTTIPHVTQFDEADITDLEAFRKQVNAEQDVKVTMVALVMKAVVASLKAHPTVNSVRDGDDALILKRSYHLGFAADTPQGLLVPVIKDADRKGLLQIAAELRELSGKARDGKLKLPEMQGATFTISSLGGIGGTMFTPIINPPQVGILGVSRSEMKPVWDGSAFVPRLMLPLSFSYDHRVIDGALAARFTTHLAGVLSDLRRVLL